MKELKAKEDCTPAEPLREQAEKKDTASPRKKEVQAQAQAPAKSPANPDALVSLLTVFPGESLEVLENALVDTRGDLNQALDALFSLQTAQEAQESKDEEEFDGAADNDDDNSESECEPESEEEEEEDEVPSGDLAVQSQKPTRVEPQGKEGQRTAAPTAVVGPEPKTGEQPVAPPKPTPAPPPPEPARAPRQPRTTRRKLRVDDLFKAEDVPEEGEGHVPIALAPPSLTTPFQPLQPTAPTATSDQDNQSSASEASERKVVPMPSTSHHVPIGKKETRKERKAKARAASMAEETASTLSASGSGMDSAAPSPVAQPSAPMMRRGSSLASTGGTSSSSAATGGKGSTNDDGNGIKAQGKKGPRGKGKQPQQKHWIHEGASSPSSFPSSPAPFSPAPVPASSSSVPSAPTVPEATQGPESLETRTSLPPSSSPALDEPQAQPGESDEAFATRLAAQLVAQEAEAALADERLAAQLAAEAEEADRAAQNDAAYAAQLAQEAEDVERAAANDARYAAQVAKETQAKAKANERVTKEDERVAKQLQDQLEEQERTNIQADEKLAQQLAKEAEAEAEYFDRLARNPLPSADTGKVVWDNEWIFSTSVLDQFEVFLPGSRTGLGEPPKTTYRKLGFNLVDTVRVSIYLASERAPRTLGKQLPEGQAWRPEVVSLSHFSNQPLQLAGVVYRAVRGQEDQAMDVLLLVRTVHQWRIRTGRMPSLRDTGVPEVGWLGLGSTDRILLDAVAKIKTKAYRSMVPPVAMSPPAAPAAPAAPATPATQATPSATGSLAPGAERKAAASLAPTSTAAVQKRPDPLGSNDFLRVDADAKHVVRTAKPGEGTFTLLPNQGDRTFSGRLGSQAIHTTPSLVSKLQRGHVSLGATAGPSSPLGVPASVAARSCRGGGAGGGSAGYSYAECRAYEAEARSARADALRAASAAHTAQFTGKVSHLARGATSAVYAQRAQELSQTITLWATRAAHALVQEREQGDAATYRDLKGEIVDLHHLSLAEALAVVRDRLARWQAKGANGPRGALNLVTGMGKHSVNHVAVLRPKVLEELTRQGVGFRVNHGIVTVRPPRNH